MTITKNIIYSFDVGVTTGIARGEIRPTVTGNFPGFVNITMTMAAPLEVLPRTLFNLRTFTQQDEDALYLIEWPLLTSNVPKDVRQGLEQAVRDMQVFLNELDPAVVQSVRPSEWKPIMKAKPLVTQAVRPYRTAHEKDAVKMIFWKALSFKQSSPPLKI